MFDVFFPQLISIGDNTIIGYNVTVLTHEFLVREYHKGPLRLARGFDWFQCHHPAGSPIGDGAVVGPVPVNRYPGGSGGWCSCRSGAGKWAPGVRAGAFRDRFPEMTV